MAKKSRRPTAKRNTRKRTGNPARGADKVVSLAARRTSQELDFLVPDFVRWLTERGTDNETSLVLEMVNGFFRVYAEEAGAASVTAVEPDPAAEMVGSLLAVDPELAALVCSSMHEFLHFLDDSGRWTGSRENYNGVHTLLTAVMSGEEPGDFSPDNTGEPPAVVVPLLSDEQISDAHESLPLVRRVRALLEWIGPGREVTATGVLRLKDIQAAAACVDVAAAGSRAAAPGPGEGPVRVKSMTDVPRLPRYWHAMREAGLLAVTSVRARTTPKAAALLSPGSPQAREAVRDFASAYIRTIAAEGSNPFQAMATQVAVALLVNAASAEPVVTEQFLAARAAAAGADGAGPKIDGIVMSLVGDRVQDWADEGLVTLGTHIRVPEALRICVADALAEDFDLEVDGAGAASRRASTGTAPRPTPSSTYQLKVQLAGARPPIWRRVLLPAGTTLDAVHRTIQLLFAWDDTHLHQFQSGGRRGSAYGPREDENAYWGDPPGDESAVTLADVLAREKDKLEYTYDFGDDWAHTITLEKILDAGQPGELPRCTGGRGHAPWEDSGGVWGWMELVAAVNDPSHERHDELIEWTGLRTGLDPSAFDAAEVNRRLAALRG